MPARLRFLIRSVYRGFSRLIEAEVGSRHAYHLRAMVISEGALREDGLSQREAQQACRPDGKHHRRRVEYHGKAGWITRERDPEDRRRVRVVLTKEGRALKRLLPHVPQGQQRYRSMASPRPTSTPCAGHWKKC